MPTFDEMFDEIEGKRGPAAPGTGTMTFDQMFDEIEGKQPTVAAPKPAVAPVAAPKAAPAPVAVPEQPQVVGPELARVLAWEQERDVEWETKLQARKLALEAGGGVVNIPWDFARGAVGGAINLAATQLKGLENFGYRVARNIWYPTTLMAESAPLPPELKLQGVKMAYRGIEESGVMPGDAERAALHAYARGMEQYLAEHPSLTPDSLAGQIGAGMPYVAEMIGIGAVTGGTGVAFAGFITESQSIYEDTYKKLKATGTDETEARLLAQQSADVGGLINTAIELAEIGQTVRFIKGKKVLLLNRAKKIAASKLRKAGEYTKEMLVLAAANAIEEAGQQLSSEGVPYMLAGAEIEGGAAGLANRMMQSAKVGAGVAALTGVGGRAIKGAVAGKKAPAQPTVPSPQPAEPVTPLTMTPTIEPGTAVTERPPWRAEEAQPEALPETPAKPVDAETEAEAGPAMEAAPEVEPQAEAPAAEAAPQGKQAWEMTDEEYEKELGQFDNEQARMKLSLQKQWAASKHPSLDKFEAGELNKMGVPQGDWDRSQRLRYLTLVGYSRDILTPLLEDAAWAEYAAGAQEAIEKYGKQETPTTASLQQAADVAPEQELMGAGIQLPGIRRPARQGVVPQPVQVPDTAVEQAMQAASGVQRQTVLAKIKEVAVSALHKATRPQENIPRTGKFAAANEFFRLLKNIPAQVSDDSARRIAAVVDPLSPQELQLFERVVITRNMVAALDNGEPLRFRFQSRQQVEAYKAQLETLLGKSPNVQKALENQHVVRSEMLQELVKYDILPKTVLDNVDTYFHQQVLSKLQADRLVGASSARRIKRAAQQARVTGPESLGAEYDYNTSYVEAEWTWMAELSAELEKEKSLRALDKQYGIKDQLQAEAKAAGAKDWREMLRNHPDHAIWQPKPGNVFYRANTIPEQVAEYLLQNPEQWTDINSNDLGKVLALGQKNREFVLPENIVKELDNLSKPKPSGAVSALAQEAMRGWKVWTLFWPKRAVSYMLRNVTGDFDPVAGAAPGVVKYVPKATPELWRFARGNLSLSPDMKRARDLGVVSSGMTTVEIPDLKDLKVFSRFYDARASGNENLAAQYFKTVKGYNEFRENVLRYSSYLYYLDKLKTGKLANYGGANKAVVDALAEDMGNEVAAAHLARNLMGDYGDRTVFGNWMRLNMMPFFSWTEINLHRYPRMFFNAAIEGKLRGGTNKAAVAALGTLATARLAMLYTALYSLNRLFFPEDDDKLSDDDRASLHITLGHNADGSVRVFRNVGALSDFTEWFGINTMASLYPKYANGQISTGEMLKEAGKAPLNKLAFGLRPEIGAALSLAGISLYPDAFNPRSIDTAEGLTSTFGLRDEYIEVAGRIGGTGKRARPHYAQRWFVGVVQPAENALSATYDLRETFLKKEGRPRPVMMGESSIKAMRQAVSHGDYDAFLEARKAYLESGKTYRNWRAALSAIDPIGNSLNAEDEKKFIAWLSEDQRSKVDMARDYARGLEVEMWKWWQRAGAAGEADTLKGTDAEIAAKAAKLYTATGEYRTVSLELRGEKRQAARAEQAEARKWLAERGIGRPVALRAMRKAAAARK